MTFGLSSLRTKSFTILADLDGNNCAKIPAPVKVTTAAKSIYHERCFLINDDLNSLRHSIASKLTAVHRPQGRDVRHEFFHQVSRALKSLKSRRTTQVTAKIAERPTREVQMEKPMFVTTVRSGVFLEPPPEVAVLLGLRKNSSDERLFNRKLRPVKSTEMVYSFASKPRIVGSTNGPPTPPNGPSVANHKRLFKRQVDEETNRNGCTMTSTAAAAAMDGSIQFGGNTMHDRRVARGSNFASSRFNASTTENVLSRQAEARRRAAVRQRAQIRARKLRSRTPPPVDGRRHGEMQTDKYLEELTDREMNTSAVGCQADLLPINDDEDDRFTSSVSNMTTPRIDAQTQLDENELIFQLQSTNDYDEVQGNTVIVSTVNKILKEAILEINAEIEKFQNTKEILSTRVPQPGMNKEDHTIIFTKHELCSLLRNFNAQNEHFDWPILDFDETSYNSLVNDVFEHLRRVLTDLDFLADITRKQLELRQIKSPKKIASPPLSPPENSETTRSIKALNGTIQNNNTNNEDDEMNNSTAAPETDESEIKKNETTNTSDLLDLTSETEQKQDKSNSTYSTAEERYSTEEEVKKVDETPETSIQMSSPDTLSNNAEVTNLEPKRDSNEDSSIGNDEKESDKKTETETVNEQQKTNPQSTEEETEKNAQSPETNEHKENELEDSNTEKLSGEDTETENSTMQNIKSDKGIDNETRTHGSEIQQGLSSDNLNAEEIHDQKNEQNNSGNLKPLSDQENEVRQNETVEAESTEQVSNGIKANYMDADTQDSKSEVELDLKGEENQMSNANQESSEEQQELIKTTIDNDKSEERSTTPTESKVEIKNAELNEPQPDQMQLSNSDEENRKDIVNDEVENSTSVVSDEIEAGKEPLHTNDETKILSNSNEKTDETIANSVTNEITTEAENSEKDKSSSELNEEKIEESTASLQTKSDENLTEKGTNSLQSVDSRPVPEITVQQSETDHLNEAGAGNEIEVENEESQKISSNSNVQLSENNPGHSETQQEVSSEIRVDVPILATF